MLVLFLRKIVLKFLPLILSVKIVNNHFQSKCKMSVTKTVRCVQFQIALWPSENAFVAHWWAMAYSLEITDLAFIFYWPIPKRSGSMCWALSTLCITTF